MKHMHLTFSRSLIYFTTALIMVVFPISGNAIDPDVHFIARGTLIEEFTFGESKRARYKIEEVILGEINNTNIWVGFFPMAQKGELPVEAVLLLEGWSDSPNSYSALGMDPTKGILPDTPQNQAMARSLTPEDLKSNPADKQSSEDQARAVAEQFIQDNNLQGIGVLKLRRASHGWVGIWESTDYPGFYLFIGDDGAIKYARDYNGGPIKPYRQKSTAIPEALPDWPAGSYKVEEVELEYAALRASRENPGSAPSYHEPVRYRVIERLKGSFDPGVQVVEIDKAADAYIQFAKGNHADELFPHEAILIVFSVSEPSVVSPVDTLASRGILPATPENLQRVKAATLESLTANPKEMQISLPEAAAIVKRHLSARDLWPPKGTWEINRLGFGWCFINPANGFVALYVGDDGEVKYHFDEQDMPE